MKKKPKHSTFHVQYGIYHYLESVVQLTNSIVDIIFLIRNRFGMGVSKDGQHLRFQSFRGSLGLGELLNLQIPPIAVVAHQLRISMQIMTIYK